jgi:hypothetical protein
MLRKSHSYANAPTGPVLPALSVREGWWATPSTKASRAISARVQPYRPAHPKSINHHSSIPRRSNVSSTATMTSLNASNPWGRWQCDRMSQWLGAARHTTYDTPTLMARAPPLKGPLSSFLPFFLLLSYINIASFTLLVVQKLPMGT